MGNRTPQSPADLWKIQAQVQRSLPAAKRVTVALLGDYSLNSVAAFLALIRLQCIIVPLAPSSTGLKDLALKIAQVDYTIETETPNHCVH